MISSAESASITPPTLKTHTISFRCPEEIIKEMEILCQHNKLDRSGFIVQALQSMFNGLAEKGVCKPQPPLPPCPIPEEESSK